MQESSFSNVTTPPYPGPPPIDCENLEYQRQYKLVNRKVKLVNPNVKLFGFFGLILLAAILGVAIFSLCVDLKLSFAIQFIEGNPESGSENKVELSVQPDLALNLTVHHKTSSSSAPELEVADIAEDTGSRTWNLAPCIRD